MKAKFENSQFAKYTASVLNIFITSGKNKKNRETMIETKPEIKNNLVFLFKVIKKRGKRMIGNIFIRNEQPKAMPEKINLIFSFKVSFDFLKNNNNKADNRKNIVPESICPEAAISITGKGCHAYSIDLIKGRLNFFRIFIITIHVKTSRITRMIFIPVTVFPKNAPILNNTCAAGG